MKSVIVILSILCFCYLTACYQSVETINTYTNTPGSSTTSNPKNPSNTPQSPTGDSAGQVTINSFILNPCASSNLIDSLTLLGKLPLHDTIIWHFSDGTSAKTTGLSVIHVFPNSGNNVIQAVIDSGKKVLDTIYKVIYIAPLGGAMTASFASTPIVETQNGYKYYFNTNSMAYISQYTWNFGDGSTPQTTTNPSIYYLFPPTSAATNYTVQLTVSNANGCSNSTKNQITVPASSSYQKLSDTLTYSYTSPCSSNGESFTFSCLLNEPANTYYQWDFGDKTTGNGQTVTHSYSKAGYYTVTLNISQNGKTIFGNTLQNLKAFGPGSIPTASFTYNSVDSIFTFQNTSTINNNTTLNCYWNFGDSTNTITNATTTTHSYKKLVGAQQKNVGLRVTSVAGCSDTTTLTIMVPSK